MWSDSEQHHRWIETPKQQRENKDNHNLRRSWWRQELPQLAARDCWQPRGVHSRGFNAKPSPLPSRASLPLPSLPTGMATSPSVCSPPRSLDAHRRRTRIVRPPILRPRNDLPHSTRSQCSSNPRPASPSTAPWPRRVSGRMASSRASHFHPDHPSGCSKRCYLGTLRKWYSGQLWTRFRQIVLGDNF